MTEALAKGRWGLGSAATRRILRLLCSAAAATAVLYAPLATAQETLYHRVGGIYGIAATVDDLVDRLYVNGTLNANPIVQKIHAKGQKAGFKVMVTNWVAEKSGGLKIYTGMPLDKAHAHLNLSDREFDVVMNECATTFYKFNVPKKEMDELMALLESFRPQVVAKK